MHRSGTTWVGRMLAASREAVYLHEPLNPVCAPTLLHLDVGPQYLYVTEENEEAYLPAFRRLLELPFESSRLERSASQRGRRLARLAHARATGARPLLKDPFALLSIPWFVERLGSDVVAVVRHPLAIAGSAKRLEWGFDSRWLLDQPLLMRDRLEPHRAELEAPPTTIVGQTALFWRLAYEAVRDYARRLPQVRVVLHEDLSREPVAQYRRLYESLGLTFGRRVERAIERTTRASNPAETQRERPDTIELDSRANLETWKRRLTDEEAELVRRQTADIARAFYGNDST
jgi:hypothetical protein